MAEAELPERRVVEAEVERTAGGGAPRAASGEGEPVGGERQRQSTRPAAEGNWSAASGGGRGWEGAPGSCGSGSEGAWRRGSFGWWAVGRRGGGAAERKLRTASGGGRGGDGGEAGTGGHGG